MSDEGKLYDAPRARNALRLAKEALNKLRQDPEGVDWQLFYVAAHAILRTSADVMDRHDRKDKTVHPAMREEIKNFLLRLGDTKPEPHIYWDFIRQHANDILHDFGFSSVMDVTIQVPTVTLRRTVSAAGQTTLSQIPSTISGSKSLTYRVKKGHFVGQDPRDVLQFAIEFMESEIDGMVSRAKKRP